MEKKKQAKKTDKKPEKKTEPEPIIEPVAPVEPKTEGVSRLFLFVAVFCAFFIGMAAQNICSHISISWDNGGQYDRGDCDSASVSGWCKSNRPKLKEDYSAVGEELVLTAERINSGILVGSIDAMADTIARVQPSVSDPAAWREFLSALKVRIGDVSAAELSEKYREAASAFGKRAADVPEPVFNQEVITDEEENNEAVVENSDSDSALDIEGLDESEDQANDGGEDRGTVPPDDGAGEGTGGERARAERGCPGGQCPAGARSSSPYYWPFQGWFGW